MNSNTLLRQPRFAEDLYELFLRDGRSALGLLVVFVLSLIFWGLLYAAGRYNEKTRLKDAVGPVLRLGLALSGLFLFGAAVFSVLRLWPHALRGLEGLLWLPPALAFVMAGSSALIVLLCLVFLIAGGPAISVGRVRRWWSWLLFGLLFALLPLLLFSYPYAYAAKYGIGFVGLLLGRTAWQSAGDRLGRLFGGLALVAAGLCLLVLFQRFLRPDSTWMRWRELIHVILFVVGGVLFLQTEREWGVRRLLLVFGVALLAFCFQLYSWWDCHRRADDFKRHMNAWLTQIEQLGESGFMPIVVNPPPLPQGELGRPLTRENSVALSRLGVHMNGQAEYKAFADPAWSRQLEEWTSRSNDPQDKTFVLAVSGDVKWGSMSGVLQQASRVGMDRLLMAFEKKPQPASMRSHSEVEAFIAKLDFEKDRAEKLVLTARLMIRLGEFCPDCRFLSGRGCCFCDAREMAVYLMREMPKALRACGCAADVTAMYRLVENAFVGPFLQVKSVDLCAPGEVDCPLLSLPAEMPWSEASKHFFRALAEGEGRLGFVDEV